MTAPLGAVLFDLDGTLVDSLETIAKAMVEALALHGHQHATEEIIPRIGPPMNVMAMEIAGAPLDEAERINEDYLSIYYGRLIQQTPPHEGAGALLDELKQAGLRLGIVTNKNEYGGRLMLQIQRWNHLFDVVVGRDTAAGPKPSPEAAWHALRRLGVAPQHAAIVGDTEFDMQCGRDARLAIVIGVLGERSEERLRESGATHVVSSLAQVAPILLSAGVRR